MFGKQTPSFVLELELSYSSNLLNKLYPVKHKGISIYRQAGQESFLIKQCRIANAVYNALLQEALHRRNLVMHDPAFRQARADYSAAKKQGKGTSVFSQVMKARKAAFGFTEFDMHAYAAKVKSYFNNPFGIDEFQKLATKAFDAVSKTLTGKAKKVRFHRWNDDIAIEGKSDRSTLKYIGHRCIQFGKGNIYPLIVKKNDVYAEQALTHRVKYVRLVSKVIRGTVRFYAQLVMEGIPPKTKNLSYGDQNARVGLDLGTSTVAVSSDKEVRLYELAPGQNVDEKELRRIQRAMDRSLRANNPNNYNPDGTVKRGCKTWVKSNRYKKLELKRRELFRRISWNRKCSHNALANHLCSLGCDIRVEQMKMAALAKRAKNTTINKNNGRIHSKKRYGKSIMTRAPAMLISAVRQKLGYIGASIKEVDTYKVKASQYDHMAHTYKKKQLSERWSCLGDRKEKVQRDLYSAFLIMNTDKYCSHVLRLRCYKNYRHFKHLHDKEVERLKKLDNKTLRWYVA